MITVTARTTTVPSEADRVDVAARGVIEQRQGPAEVVEVDGVGDLAGREAAGAHRHAVPMENAADRSSFDTEPIAQFAHRRAGLIAGDQLLDLVVAELPGTSGSILLSLRPFGRVEAGSFSRSRSRVLTWSFGF